jgi:5-formyltetrahydrofolate cyclo-ligase
MSDLDKQELREQAKKHRAKLQPNMDEAESACRLFFEAVQPQSDDIIALYWPKKNEFSTQLILENLLDQGRTCVLPVMQEDSRILKFAAWQHGQPLAQKAFGVYEPIIDEATDWKNPDIVIVPMLAFDRTGNRLGYGGGFYDATLESLRKQKSITAVGVAYDSQMVLFPLPREEHDEPLDLVITPQKVYRF